MPDASALDLLAHQQQKRARAQLSCTACRSGKLKCNRAHPACDQCIKRGKESSCQYVAAPTRKKPNQSMKDRIKQLEGLVVELYNSNNSTSESPDSNGTKNTSSLDGSPQNGKHTAVIRPGQTHGESDSSKAFGRMKISKTENRYVGDSHWEAILDNIAEVRAALDEPEDGSDAPQSKELSCPTAPMQSLLQPNPKIRPTRAEFIRALPPKPRADSLIMAYFNSYSPSVVALHRPTFQQEYQEFWQNPDSKSMIWIAILYGLLSLASRQEDYGTQTFRAPKGTASEETLKYHGLAASAIIMAGYAHPKEGVVEAIMLYTEGVYMDTEGDHMEVWLLLAVNIRLAFRMGYHRDGSYSGISPFLSEMRRRKWTVLYQFDVLLSFEMGLPGMVLQVQQDAKIPSNFFDSDFSISSDPLPPGRPDSELTPLSYNRTKARVAKVFGKIAEFCYAIERAPYAEVLALDKQLHEVHDSIPQVLRVKPLEECITDAPGVLMCRFNIDLLVQKSRCLLHRRYLIEPMNGDFSSLNYSRATCIDAAMKILRQLARIDSACEKKMMPKGWYISSLNTHDFLLSSMVISLELDRRLRSRPEYGDSKADAEELEQMRALLEATYQIWQKPMHRSPETQKASKAVLLMLSKVARSTRQKEPTANDIPTPYAGLKTPFNAQYLTMRESPTQQAQDILTSTDIPSMEYGNGTAQLPMDFGEIDQFTPIGDMFDMPMDLDWVRYTRHLP